MTITTEYRLLGRSSDAEPWVIYEQATGNVGRYKCEHSPHIRRLGNHEWKTDQRIVVLGEWEHDRMV